MKKTFVLAIFFLATNVYALKWEKLYSDSKTDIFLYEKKIKKGKFTYGKLMVSFLEPINPNSSLFMKLKFNCKNKKIIVLRKDRYFHKHNDLLNSGRFNQFYPLNTKITKIIIDKIC